MNGMYVKNRVFFFLLGFVGCAVLPAVVVAQNAPPRSEEEFQPGRFMMGIAYPFAGVNVRRTSSSEDNGQSNSLVNAVRHSGYIGWSSWPRLNLAVRVRDHLLLGIEGGAGWIDENRKDELNSSTSKQRYVQIKPYAEWLFLHGRAQPYVRVSAGYLGNSNQYDYDYQTSDAYQSSSSRFENHGLSVSAGAGLHYFLGEHFSLGAALDAGYDFLKGEGTSSRQSNAFPQEDSRKNETTQGFFGLVSFNLAAWI